MRKTITFILVSAFLISSAYPVYASDWDKAGKAFAIIEGVRVLTGGKVDLIGNMAGIGNNSYSWGGSSYRKHHRFRKKNYCTTKVWVPKYRWKKKYVPKHEEYDHEYGKIIVDGHYIKYKVERGGHWEKRKEICRH